LARLQPSEAEDLKRLMDLREIGTLDQASLERIHTELVSAGFNPVASDLRRWNGPAVDSFRPLTAASRMEILFQDGWPNLHPKIFVKGIVGEHVNEEGEVCLWQSSDMSFQWLTWDGIKARIAEWCKKFQQGFDRQDLVLDAHLYYEGKKSELMALIDFKTLKSKPLSDGDCDDFFWTIRKPNLAIINSGKADTNSISGRWYFRTDIKVPPRNFDIFRNVLTSAQQKNFDRGTKSIITGAQNAQCLFILLWKTSRGLNALIVRAFKNSDGSLGTAALEAAPTDHESLKLRAGPDVTALDGQKVVLFGAGAIGSHVALLLAEMGIKSLIICDYERLRPGNVVRHVAGQELIGYPKVFAVEQLIGQHAPWTTVTTIPVNSWNPADLKRLIGEVNLIIDATGLAAFTDQLSRLAEQSGVSLVSIALFRGGRLGRVRRQVAEKDVPIYRRHENTNDYPQIPPGREEEEIAGLEAGCSAPIVNASPAVVQAVASLSARIMTDLISRRFEFSEECVEVYRPIEKNPFSALGLLQLGKNS